MEYIRIRGASQHNLKNVDVDIPRDRLVVITGVSGSGKSSLAFDTIFAEGQRRYVESLSTYARQFIGQMDKPEVESIEGLSPAIAIEQRATSQNPRSTVGTVTEIYDYLRLLFSRIGIPHCHLCHREIKSQTVDTMLDQILGLPEETKVTVYSPIISGKKGEFSKELKKLRKGGFVRVRVDGQVHDLGDEITLDKKKKHNIDVVVDRLVVREGIRKRLRDSLEIALELADGLVVIGTGQGEEIIFSERYSCPNCNISISDLSPRMFSFNSPYGACPDCGGLGTRMYFDEDLVVSDPGLSIREGAIVPWEKRNSIQFYQMLEAMSAHYGFDINMPFAQLPQEIRKVLLYGSDGEEIKFYFDKDGRRHFYSKSFEGVINSLDRRYRETASNDIRSDLSRYMNIRECPSCGGAGSEGDPLCDDLRQEHLRPEPDICPRMHGILQIPCARRPGKPGYRRDTEGIERLGFLLDVGMDYLSLNRSSGTLSGGEWQRQAGDANRLGAGRRALRAR